MYLKKQLYRNCPEPFKSAVIEIFILCVLFLLPFYSAAQVYPYRQYNVQHGLLNPNVYFIKQDKTGFVWFATENGLSRFDGLDFVNYPISKFGIGSDITCIAALDDDEIVFSSDADGLYRIDLSGKHISKINSEQVSRSDEMIIRDSLIISLQKGRRIEFISINSGKIIAIDSVAHFDGCNIPIFIKQFSDGTILTGRSNGLYRLKDFGFIKINTGIYNDKPVYSIEEGDNGSVYVSSDNIIYKLHRDGTVETIYNEPASESRISNLLLDKRKNLWFTRWATSELVMLSNGSKSDISLLTGGIHANISRLNLTNDGTIWAGTLGKGVYSYSGSLLLNYPVQSGLDNPSIRKLKQTSDGLLMGTSNGITYYNFRTGKFTYVKHIPDVTLYVRDIIQLEENKYLVGITDFRIKDQFKKFTIPGEAPEILYIQSSGLTLNKNELYAANWDNRYLRFSYPEFKFREYVGPLLPEFNYNLRINNTTRDQFGHLWIGTKHGMRIWDRNGEQKNVHSDISRFEVYRFIVNGHDSVCAVTSSGLYFFKTDSNSDSIDYTGKIVVPSANCMLKTGKNEYLFGTTEGLVLVNDSVSLNITVNDGLLSNIIDDLLFVEDQNAVYIASAEGLMKMDIVQLHSLLKAKPVISYVRAEQDTFSFTSFKDRVDLDYSSGPVNLEFRTFEYNNPASVVYEYRVDGSEWTKSNTGNIQFASIAPGPHTIELRSGIKDLFYGDSVPVNVNIIPPFYRTWWFYLVIAAAFILLTVFFYSRQVRAFKRKQEERQSIRQKLTELRQRALSSSLNPHFVFNSLNSIQHFINSNNNRDANIYLARFSRLMRMHLDMAEKSSIRLHEELSRLRFYLDLENMRFGDSLTWEIVTDPRLDEFNTEIPNMIIQPFVENSIWHGIMPSKDPGKVKIEVTLAPDDELLIVVTDNGIGIANSRKSAPSGHESKGLKLIRQRLELLDPAAVNTLEFTTLTKGTRVTVRLSSKMFKLVRSELQPA